MKKIVLFAIIIALTSSCSIYRKYQRPEDLPVEMEVDWVRYYKWE